MESPAPTAVPRKECLDYATPLFMARGYLGQCAILQVNEMVPRLMNPREPAHRRGKVLNRRIIEMEMRSIPH